MSQTAIPRAALLSRFGRLRELLELVAAIRGIDEPITSPDGLARTIDLLIRLAELAGVDRGWTDRLRSIVEDETTFNVVLAIVRFMVERIGHRGDGDRLIVAMADGSETVVSAQSFFDWLPIVIEIINLIRLIRGSG